tara:strand:+ start:164 stop:403 length:240 start_codon:yes stop_codon:yes gene_type:complete
MSLTIEQLEAIVKNQQVEIDELTRAVEDVTRWKRETINKELRIRQLRETQEERTRAKNKKKKEEKEFLNYDRKTGRKYV